MAVALLGRSVYVMVGDRLGEGDVRLMVRIRGVLLSNTEHLDHRLSQSRG